MTVKRYANCGVDMIEFDAGEYVHLDDYVELQRQLTAYEATVTNLTAQVQGLSAENAALKKFCKNASFDADYEAELAMERGGFTDALNDIKTPATDAALAEIRNEARAECLSGFVAFIKQRAKEFPQSVVADCLDVLINNVGQCVYSQQLRKEQGND